MADEIKNLNAGNQTALASAIDRFLGTSITYAASTFEMAADVYGGHYHSRQGLNRSQGHQSGVVTFAIPYVNSYRVALAGLNSETICLRSQPSSGTGFFGPIDCTLLPPNENVQVNIPPGELFGFIEGVEEQQVEDGSLMFSDAVQQGTMVGLRKDVHYKVYLTATADEGACIDASHHRPLDQISGDGGFCFYTGLGLFLNANMLVMRSSEVCGLWVGYGDWARLAGDPLQIWSGCGEMVGGSEEGELYYKYNESMYPWERLGAFEDGTPVHRDVPPDDMLNKKPESTLEPIQTEQIPFGRYEEFGGYLGQGRIRQISVPPPSATSDVYTANGNLTPVTVFRESISPKGAYALASATEVIIAKRNLLAPIRQKKLPDDLGENADNLKNYKPSGKYGGGEAHKAGGVVFGGTNRILTQWLSLLDTHTHRFNWQAIRTFRYHKKDYAVKQESELNGTIGRMRIKPTYAELKSKMWLLPPEKKTLYVDHLYKSIDIYEVFSHMTLTDDGSIVIQANAGEELRLGGGSAVLGAPGNVIFQSGKTVSILAGDDAIIRANNSVDITATKKDVRLKAELNLQALAGNGYEGGGILLESRAQDKTQKYPAEGGEKIRSSGIVLKAPKSEVAVLSAGTYFKTGGKELDPGQIVFDVAEGNQNIIFLAQNIVQFVAPGGSFLQAFGMEKPVKVNEATQGRLLVATPLWVNGYTMIDGPLLCRNDVVSADGHFQSARGGPVGQIVDRTIYTYQLNEIEQAEKAAVLLGSVFWYDYNNTWTTYDKIGNPDTIRKVSFSLRDEKQYNTEDFLLPEAAWQQISQGDGLVAWRENIVRYQPTKTNTGGVELMPWPGKKAWSENEAFLKIDVGSFVFYDAKQNHAKDTTAVDYGDTKTVTPSKRVCQSDYKVIDVGE